MIAPSAGRMPSGSRDRRDACNQITYGSATPVCRSVHFEEAHHRRDFAVKSAGLSYTGVIARPSRMSFHKTRHLTRFAADTGGDVDEVSPPLLVVPRTGRGCSGGTTNDVLR